MSKKQNGKGASLADPTRLKPFNQEKLLQVVIETPKGCRNKYSYDQDQGVFMLKAVLPAGMEFPYDFGFLPRTLADDGDPIDVLLLMDAPAFPGCLIPARLLGVIEGEQIDTDGKKVRNDRLVAVAAGNHAYADVKKLADIPKSELRELGDFFANYHRLEGKRFKVLGHKEAPAAMKLINTARKAA